MRKGSDLPKNQEDREVYLRGHGVNAFVAGVSEAPSGSSVFVPRDEFGDNLELRQVALSYAEQAGIRVIFADPVTD